MDGDYTPVDLAAVIYSAGKVFDGLRTGRLDTEEFLRTGNTSGIASRADLALLRDLQDAAAFIIANSESGVDADFVMSINAQLARSAALHPGRLRTASQNIGVSTRYGRHSPPPIRETELADLIQTAASGNDEVAAAKLLFLELAKAQPFEDGNKRTALMAANGLLFTTAQVLTVPTDNAEAFSDALARAYINDEYGVLDLLETSAL